MKNDANKCLSSKYIFVRKTALATILLSLMSFPISVWSAEITKSEFDLSKFTFPDSDHANLVDKGLIGEDTNNEGLLNRDVFNAVYFDKVGGGGQKFIKPMYMLHKTTVAK